MRDAFASQAERGEQLVVRAEQRRAAVPDLDAAVGKLCERLEARLNAVERRCDVEPTEGHVSWPKPSASLARADEARFAAEAAGGLDEPPVRRRDLACDDGETPRSGSDVGPGGDTDASHGEPPRFG
jgi:hypothetical protein